MKNFLMACCAAAAVVMFGGSEVLAQVPTDLDTTLGAQTAGVATLATAGTTAASNLIYTVVSSAILLVLIGFGVSLLWGLFSGRRAKC